ncbi:nucleotide-diphospho-sugar transferase, partial [Mucilaginibacter sp. 5C4]|nr:nucleotide-diphospho-sugar transferase [Mucilaginibacter sp. 5C4]
MDAPTISYKTKSAVLFIVFNRPDTTDRVFEQIRAAQPSRLYVAADGPRAQKAGEDVLCERTRAITAKVDWPCEVKTLFRESNLGCKNAVSSAIDWFFNNEEEGIILEDDCLPNPDFFRFCDAMLDKYR